MDGKPLGTTTIPAGSLVLPHLSRGTHLLTVSYPGFDSWSKPISLGWFEMTHPLNVTLQVPSFPLTVQTNPAGADVQLDMHDAGISNARGYLVIQKVPRGQHMITVLLNGYPTRASTLWVSGPSSIRIDLAAALNSVSSTNSQGSATSNVEAQQWLARAKTQYQGGDFSGAIQSCDSALRLNPSDAEAAQLKSKIQETMKILGKQ